MEICTIVKYGIVAKAAHEMVKLIKVIISAIPTCILRRTYKRDRKMEHETSFYIVHCMPFNEQRQEFRDSVNTERDDVVALGIRFSETRFQVS